MVRDMRWEHKWLIFLNTLDAVFTTFFIVIGVGKELNPVMAALINISPLLFFGFKVILLNGVIVLLSKRQDRMFLWGLRFLVFTYSLIALSHLRNVGVVLYYTFF